jgi:hypothetical protein
MHLPISRKKHYILGRIYQRYEKIQNLTPRIWCTEKLPATQLVKKFTRPYGNQHHTIISSCCSKEFGTGPCLSPNNSVDTFTYFFNDDNDDSDYCDNDHNNNSLKTRKKLTLGVSRIPFLCEVRAETEERT